MEATRDAIELIRADQRTLASLLQKSIQRGDSALAQIAAVTLLKLKGYASWRRLLNVAFEDVGPASLDTLLFTADGWKEPKQRKSAGMLLAAATQTARRLAESPKDRTAADLFRAVMTHPCFHDMRQKYKDSNASHFFSLLGSTISVYEGATIVCAALGIEWNKDLQNGGENFAKLMRVFRDLGVPEGLIEATAAASTELRRPFFPLVPLVYLARKGRGSSISRTRQRCAPVVHRVPVYVLDGTTRIGRMAVRRFITDNSSVRRCLEENVPSFSRIDAAYLAAYHADALLVAKRSVWQESNKITSLAVESDFARAGVPLASVRLLIQTFRDHLPQFDALRAALFATYMAEGRLT